MKKLFLSIFTLILVGGCTVLPPLPASVKALENQFVLSKDDSSKHGANPTYVLLERFPNDQWQIAAISKNPIKFTRGNQEQVLIDRNYTNVVPTWDKFDITYNEDPKTGRRTNYEFTGGSYDKRENYSPADSKFALIQNEEAMPTLSGIWSSRYVFRLNIRMLGNVVAQTNLIEEARAFNDGRKTFASTAQKVQPLQLPPQVWVVYPKGGGDVGRYYFVPTRLRTIHGEYIESGSSLTITGLKSGTNFEEIKRMKMHNSVSPKSKIDTGCISSIVDLITVRELDVFSCNSASRWKFPLSATSATLGFVPVLDIEGSAYDLKGSQRKNRASLQFSIDSLAEFQVLPAGEAARVTAILR